MSTYAFTAHAIERLAKRFNVKTDDEIAALAAALDADDIDDVIETRAGTKQAGQYHVVRDDMSFAVELFKGDHWHVVTVMHRINMHSVKGYSAVFHKFAAQGMSEFDANAATVEHFIKLGF